MAVAAMAVALQAACHARAADASPLESAYLRIQPALADDKLEDAKAPSRVVAEEAGRMGEAGASMQAAAQALADAADLAAARTAFGDLSDAVLAHVGSRRPGDARLAYCPMVKKSWLQTGDAIRNPYYGHQMLSCGEFRK